MVGDPVLLSLVLGLVAAGFAESVVHRRRLAQVPIRIHVNGTRGKSSVTRLIAAGLRAGGIKTFAKTTGTLPRMILPDGTERDVFRPGAPNVIEQVRVIDVAAKCRPQALVVECMAIHPTLQWLSESRLVHATHGVITNARADHLDVMGPSEANVAEALAGMVPIRGILFTAERRHLDVFAQAAADRNTQFVAIGEEDIRLVNPLDLSGFSYVEHAENVALALRVCRDLGVDGATALRGMWNAAPDPGAMTVHELKLSGRDVNFVNGFAANDPESTERVWNLALERYPDVNQRIALVNCRQDRPDRSRQLGRACIHWQPADYYVLVGTGTRTFARAAAAAGLDMARVKFAEGQSVPDILKTVTELCGESALVVGIANIGGLGLQLVHDFSNRSKLRAS